MIYQGSYYQMLRDFDFSFARSPLALNHPPPPDNDPILHTLPPPQQPSLRNSGVIPSAQPREVGKGEFVNITLGNSPEYGNLQPIKPTHTISNFNRQVEEARRPNESQVLRTSGTRVASRVKELPFQRKVEVVPQTMNESKTERQEVRASRTVSGPFNNQHTVRNPREDTLQPKKVKFLNRQPPSGQSPDKLALVNKIEELKLRVGEGENLSRTLGMQLQITREKLKVRESQHAMLQGKMEEMAQEAETGRQTQRALAEQRRMNEYFCEEIDKQKAEVVRYEQKNEESLRLLQQLNLNITRREEKLQREMAEQTTHLDKITTEKLELQEKMKEAEDKIAALNAKIQSFETVRAENDSNAARIQQHEQQRQRQHTEIITSLKISREESISLRSSLQETTSQKDRLLMEVGKLTEENSHLKEKLEAQSALASAEAELAAEREAKMTEQYQEVMSDLKARLSHSENQVEGLFYSCKENQTKLEVATTAISDHLSEIRELKEQKRILLMEKEELKGDVKHLLQKNDEYYTAIEAGKRSELALNSSLADHQREIITLEERISENITAIADRDIAIATLSDQLTHERLLGEEKMRAIEERNRWLSELEEKLRRYEKMLSIYKQELGRLKDNKEKQWQEMRAVYEDQIVILQEKLKEFLESKERRSKAVMKRREVIEQTVTATSFAVHRVETESSVVQQQQGIEHD